MSCRQRRFLNHEEEARLLAAAGEPLRVSGAGKGPSIGQGIKSIRTAFTTACRNAKLPGVSPHTLRHTFASRLVMAGVGYPDHSRTRRIEGNQNARTLCTPFAGA